MTILEILKSAVKNKASDIFIISGVPVAIRKNGQVVNTDGEVMHPEITSRLINELYELADHRDRQILDLNGDDDFAFVIPSLARFRVCTYKQRGTLSAVIRVITFTIPDYRTLNIPDSVIELGRARKGMILVSGPAGSGKSTTLACIIDAINKNRHAHIITLEDPIEYLHKHGKSIVSQREISLDTKDYATSLNSALRQSPDVILLGEMRDLETIEMAMNAAETGHLLFSTLPTVGAVNTINRIIDVFPDEQKHQIAVQLSMVLNAIVSQQMVPTIDGNMIPVFEAIQITPAIRNLIREQKTDQINSVLYSTERDALISMDQNLLNLYRAGIISKNTAIAYSSNSEQIIKKLFAFTDKD